MATVDFLRACDKARKEINQWVKEKTEGKLLFVHRSVSYLGSRNGLYSLLSLEQFDSALGYSFDVWRKPEIS